MHSTSAPERSKSSFAKTKLLSNEIALCPRFLPVFYRFQRVWSEATGPPAGFAWLGCDVIGSPLAGAGLPLGDNGSDARYAVMLMMSSGVSFSTTIRIRAMFELDPLRIP